MSYQDLKKNLAQQISVETKIKPQAIEEILSSAEEQKTDILNMIALEIQRQGGR